MLQSRIKINNTKINKSPKGAVFWGISLSTFIIILLILPLFEQYAFLTTRIIGPLFLLVIICRFFNEMTRLPKEIYIFGIFVLWSLSGLTTAYDLNWFWRYFRFIFQIIFLMIIISTVILKFGAVQYVFLSQIVVAFLMFIMSIFKGDFFQDYSSTSTERFEGISGNPNLLAYTMFLGIVGILFFWHKTRAKWMRVLYIGMSIVLSIGIIYSGSRKNFLTLILLLVLWIFFCYRQFLFKKISVLIGVVLLFIVLYTVFIYTIEETFLGARMKRVDSAEALYEQDRFFMYKEGFEMVGSNPLLGVGLGNFMTHSITGQYSHSDFVEALSTTGIIGLGIYVTMYIVLWKRIRRIKKKYHNNDDIMYEMKLMQVVFICLVAIGLGIPHFLEVESMILVAAMVSYTNFLDRDKQTKNSILAEN